MNKCPLGAFEICTDQCEWNQDGKSCFDRLLFTVKPCHCNDKKSVRGVKGEKKDASKK